MYKNIPILILLFLFKNSVVAQFTQSQPFVWKADNNQTQISLDTDGDGDIDIITNSASSGPSIAVNNGDNTFGFPLYLSDIVTGYYELAAADADGDGDQDFFSLNNDASQITFFKNMGGNNFTENLFFDLGDRYVHKMQLQDIDGDGDSDFTCISFPNELLIFYNEGGTFTLEILEFESTVLNRHHFDADGDGDLDLIYENSEFDQLVYRENASGTYGEPFILEESFLPNSFITMDVDEDSDLDILYTLSGLDNMFIAENIGAGVFSAGTHFFTLEEPTIHSVTDLDNDEHIDIIIKTSSPSDQFHWIKHLSGGSYESPLALNPFYPTDEVEFVDCDADGDLDIIQSSAIENIIYYENIGDGDLGDRMFLSETTAWPEDMAAADLDNDGDLDLICVSYLDRKLSWVENLGDGEFSRLKVIESDFIDPEQVITADIDGDTYLDILLIDQFSDEAAWFQNLGDGTFGPQITISDEVDYPTAIHAGDWDDDGDMDVMVAANFEESILLFENIDGTLETTGVSIYEAYLLYDFNNADLDEDGDLDILFFSFSDAEIIWLENTGGLTFTSHVILDEIIDPTHLVPFDKDSDGDIDIVFSSNFDPDILWIENLGGAIFDEALTFAANAGFVGDFQLADVNNNGLIDVVKHKPADSALIWFENVGDYEFSAANVIANNLPKIKNFFIADFDADFDNDIAYVERNLSNFAWFENYTNSNHTVSGTVFIDANENGEQNDGEVGIAFAQVLSTPEIYYSYTSALGDFLLVYDDMDAGDYTLEPEPIDYWGLTTDEFYTVTIDGDSTHYTDLNFGLFPTEIVDEVNTELTSSGARMNTNQTLNINYSNVGSTEPSGTIHLELDPDLFYLSSEIEPILIEGNNLYWNYVDLPYFEIENFDVSVWIPGIAFFGDTLVTYLTVNIEVGGEIVFSSVDSVEQNPSGPYDPNDKTVKPAGLTDMGHIDPDTENLEYVIRFQNTGTDTAYNVVIKDQLDDNLDWASLNPLAWSHDMEIEFNPSGEVSFIFNDIMLPDSNVNYTGSQGFVKYEIGLLPGLPLETSIYNTAHIYFDLNPAIVTNTTVSTLYADHVGIFTNEEGTIAVYPNPFSDFTTIVIDESISQNYAVLVYNMMGTEVYRAENLTNNTHEIEKNALGNGLFIMAVVDQSNGEILFTSKLLTQ